jgi:ATP-binding cassette subfamily B protein
MHYSSIFYISYNIGYYVFDKEGIHLKFKIREFLFLIVAFFCTAIQAWSELKIPEQMSLITTYIQTPDTAFSLIRNCGLTMLFYAFIALLSAIIVVYCSARVSAAVGRESRATVFKKVLSFNNEEVEKFSTSSLISRTVRDVGVMQMIIIMGLQSCVRAPIIFALSVNKVSAMSGNWTQIIVYVIVGLIVVLGSLVAIASPRFNKIQKAFDNISRVTRESLNGIRVVRAYNGEKYQTEKFENLNNEIYKHILFTDRIMSAINPILTSVMSGISLIAYWSGAYLLSTSSAHEKLPTFSNMIVFSSYAIQVLGAFLMMGGMLFMLPRAMVHIKRVVEVLKTKPKIQDGSIELSENIQSISFKNVGFTYPADERETLKNIHFHVNQGETVAIVGSTGCGKSSIVNLLLRLYDVSYGQILINGRDIKDFKMSSIRNKIGYISQKAVLFSGNITDNVTFGEKYDKDKMDSILSLSQSSKFVNKLSDKEFANVAQNGSNYSGGQKQRLSIARALYKNPDVLIFDDSFSALDFKTDLKLRAGLKEQLENVTKIIIAQRIGTIKDADKIIVIHDGRIAGTGTHNELLAQNEIYKSIVYSQMEEGQI